MINHNENCAPDFNKAIRNEVINNCTETSILDRENVPGTTYSKTVAALKDKGLDLIKKLPSKQKVS